MNGYPKRLIEVDLPIKKISAHARREKSIRHGHISTLHIWWARRPLAACRAVLCAALWPDPADPLCPQKFRDDACRLINAFAAKAASDKTLARTCSHDTWKRWQALSKSDGGLDSRNEAHWNVLRFALLDFIADFANWDNSTVPEYLETSRALTQSAHEALGGAPGSHPLVVDPFAGGGAIPLEALRVGADAFASDINPVAVLIEKTLLQFMPRFHPELAPAVRTWGHWLKQEAEKELARFHPTESDGSYPIAYLWARTINCEGPGCGAQVPLIRSSWLARKPRGSTALKLRADQATREIKIEIVENAKASEVGPGTVNRGAVTCPVCGFTTPVTAVRRQLKQKHGGTFDARLLCVVVLGPGGQGRRYRPPTERDRTALKKAEEYYLSLLNEAVDGFPLIPRESTEECHSFVNRGPIYGMTTWRDYFSQRQTLTIILFVRLLRSVREIIARDGKEALAAAVECSLALAVDRMVDASSSLCRWHATRELHTATFGRQALPMVWDFSEVCPLSDVTGGFTGAVEWVAKVCDLQGRSLDHHGATVERASATSHPLPDDSVNAWITDPPYYYSVQYADLSDFFYIWLRRMLHSRYPGLFQTELTPKADEIIVQSPGHQYASEGKNNSFYESQMRKAMEEGRRVLAHNGIGVVVFAHTSTAGWEAQLQAMIDAGWVITGSWPIDTEMAARVIAQNRSVLASSIHLVCRPRENPDGTVREDDIGDWRDILQELPRRIHEWMPRLAKEGVVGADAIFACLGPALEIFSRYSRVEKPNGDQVTLKEYLEHVWAAVSKEAISMIFAGADTAGFEEDARLTAMWLWTLSTGASNGENGQESEAEDAEEEDAEDKPAHSPKLAGFTLEYDAARKIAQGLGAHLELLTNLVEVKGDTARLLPVAERTKALFGKEGTESPSAKRKKSAQLSLPGLLEEWEQEDSGWTLQNAAKPGSTTLDRLHQAMILFAAGRGEALRRLLVDEGVGKDPKFWRLAQSLCALYPSGTDERRWAEGVLARKKGLGL